MEQWNVQPYDRLDKLIIVTGPGDMTLFVDHDDVNHYEVGRTVEEMVSVLNKQEVAVAV